MNQRNAVFLPSIHGGPPVVPPVDPVQVFTDAWMQLLGSHAQLMNRDERLVLCAMQHASFLAHRSTEQEQYSMHIGIGFSYPNDRVFDAGYRLPDGYFRGKNNVESCARDYRDPATVIVSLANHDTHYNHLHGIFGFEGHIYWGIGNFDNDWVVVTCPPSVG